MQIGDITSCAFFKIRLIFTLLNLKFTISIPRWKCTAEYLIDNIVQSRSQTQEAVFYRLHLPRWRTNTSIHQQRHSPLSVLVHFQLKANKSELCCFVFLKVIWFCQVSTCHWSIQIYTLEVKYLSDVTPGFSIRSSSHSMICKGKLMACWLTLKIFIMKVLLQKYLREKDRSHFCCVVPKRNKFEHLNVHI